MSIQQTIRKAAGQTVQKILSIVALAERTLLSSASTTEAVLSVSLVLCVIPKVTRPVFEGREKWCHARHHDTP